MACSLHFAYNPYTKRFLIEASAITENGTKELFEPIYDHVASDRGLRIHNKQTDNDTCWLVSVVKVVEGHIESWTLIPTYQTAQKFPDLQGHTLLLFNR